MHKLFGKVEIPETGETFRTGWWPPLPDLRDYTEEDANIPKIVKNLGISPGKKSLSLPGKVDLRKWCSPIENQGALGSCTANAAVGVAEYFQHRAFGKHINGSRLFIYKATRNLMGVVGDTGAWRRNTMGPRASVVSLRKSIGNIHDRKELQWNISKSKNNRSC